MRNIFRGNVVKAKRMCACEQNYLAAGKRELAREKNDRDIQRKCEGVGDEMETVRERLA